MYLHKAAQAHSSLGHFFHLKDASVAHYLLIDIAEEYRRFRRFRYSHIPSPQDLTWCLIRLRDEFVNKYRYLIIQAFVIGTEYVFPFTTTIGLIFSFENMCLIVLCHWAFVSYIDVGRPRKIERHVKHGHHFYLENPNPLP